MAKKKKGSRRMSKSDFEAEDSLLMQILAGSTQGAHQPSVGSAVPIRSTPPTVTLAPSPSALTAPNGISEAHAAGIVSTAEATPSSGPSAEIGSTIVQEQDSASSLSVPIPGPASLRLQEETISPSHLETKLGNDGKCQHIKSAVKLPKLSRDIAKQNDWDHCQGCLSAAEPKQKKAHSGKRVESSMAAMGLTTPKAVEALSADHLWMCLSCCEINCGRAIREHSQQHHDGKKTNHPLAINLGTMDCWCYSCNSSVVPTKNRNQVIHECQSVLERRLQIRQSKMRATANAATVNATSSKTKGSAGAMTIVSNLPKIKVATPGLQNLGNTCFFNSVVQVLTETKSLKAILSEDESRYSVFPTSLAARTDAGLGPLTLYFKVFLHTMWTQQGGRVTPQDLFAQIARKWKIFRGFRQQDSQELMRYLFDGIKQEEMDLIKRQLTEEKGEDGKEDVVEEGEPQESTAAESEADPPKYVPFIDSCFLGKMVSVIVCDVCKKCSYAQEEFYDLSLPVRGPASVAASRLKSRQLVADLQEEQEGKVSDLIPDLARPSVAHLKHVEKLLRPIGQSASETLSVQRSLNQFTSVDCLDGENKFACENCYKLTVSEEDEEGGKDETPDVQQKSEEVEEEKGDSRSESQLPVSLLSEHQHESEETESADDKCQEQQDQTDADQKETEGSPVGGSNASSDSESESDSEEGEHTDRFGNTIPKPAREKKMQSKTTEAAVATPDAKKPKVVFRKAYKRYLISSLPPTLVLHLKRFEQSGRFGQMRKIEDHVEMPVELDMSPYFVPKSDLEEEGKDGDEANEAEDKDKEQLQDSKRYRLYGAVVHMGTLGGGHYTNYVLSSKVELLDRGTSVKGVDKAEEGSQEVKESDENKDDQDCRQWIACSDTSVRQASLKEVLSSRAYLLFYERV